jgi:DNA excision repair protein ERCC-6-like 2
MAHATAPDDDDLIVLVDNPLKRKGTDDVAVKDEWTDDSDSFEPFKKKRKQPLKGKDKQKRTFDSAGKQTLKSRSSWAKLKIGVKAVDETVPVDDGDTPDPDLPEYIVQRRKRFEEKSERLKEAGLRLPPLYDDIDFTDSVPLASLAKRPLFDDTVKPSRPERDIELEYSAGVIPAPIAKYLRDYQVDGVKFMHQQFVYQRGCVLGDDMGLGKTVQVVAFLTAAFGKTGDERDDQRMRKMRRASNAWYPRVLIICPGSITENWKNELGRWGWWHIGVFHGSGKEDVLQTAKAGRLEIMITTYATYKANREMVNTVAWDVVVADECHAMKERQSEVTKAMNQVNALCRIGLTGTAIQNKYDELWTLLNWTNPGFFGSLADWRRTISTPLTLGQSHDATLNQLSRARKTAKKLAHNLLPRFFLRRMKSLIADQLPKKTDKVVFCPLTDIQRDAYKNFVNSENVEHLRTVTELCDCGGNPPKKKGWCCYKTLKDTRPWMNIVFPTIMSLNKLSSHLILLLPATSSVEKKRQRELDTLQTCLPDDWQDLYAHRDSIKYFANPEFCGKWKILRKLLRFWHSSGDKVLVFSHSVRLLQMLKHLFGHTSYSVNYLDGSLSYEDRQKAVDDFNSDPNQFVFLISTKAGGVGLNITSANKVVIFDPHWNPAYDLQAQDRAYRIGQVRDVDVFRLISAGTIEEIIYARQIYKQQQANIGYNASKERRYFKGVQQDKDRKGEIFGLSNLFSYEPDQVLLREIVNKTNIAEAKAGVNLSDIDLDKAAADEDLGFIKSEQDADSGGLAQLAELLTAENQEEFRASRAAGPRSDAVQAILANAGVAYTHENSEVVGSSKVEAQLSRRAELTATAATDSDGSAVDADEGPSTAAAIFAAEAEANSIPMSRSGMGFRLLYNPPADVMRRQFCTMAKTFGFASATDFALVVESWTQEQRRNCLEFFYKARKGRLVELIKDEQGVDALEEVKREEDEVYIAEEGREEANVKDEDTKVKKEAADGAEPVRVRVKVEEVEDGEKGKRTSIFLYDSEDDEL